MKRFSVMARPHACDYEVEIAQCDSNPEAIADGARQKRINVPNPDPLIKRPVVIPAYEHVHWIDRGAMG